MAPNDTRGWEVDSTINKTARAHVLLLEREKGWQMKKVGESVAELNRTCVVNAKG